MPLRRNRPSILFGSRSKRDGSSDFPPCTLRDQDGSATRLEALRQRLANLIERYPATRPNAQAGLYIQIRGLQDLIAGIRRRNPVAAAEKSPLVWVDGWKPR